MTESPGKTTTAQRTIAAVCAGIVVVSSLVAMILAAQANAEQERRLRYQECITQEQARMAREGSLLEPEDLCNIYPGR